MSAVSALSALSAMSAVNAGSAMIVLGVCQKEITGKKGLDPNIANRIKLKGKNTSTVDNSLHVGHIRNYTITNALAHFYR
ncbi:8378_t:CDS:2, partial [Gigaspora margarita]